MASFYFRVLPCRIRIFPILISKMKWLWSGLPLKHFLKENDNGETVTSFKLETEVLEKLLLKENVGDKKIVVISVTGKVLK